MNCTEICLYTERQHLNCNRTSLLTFLIVHEKIFVFLFRQETRVLSQAINRELPHSRNQLEEGVNRKELIFYLAV